jgi:hypothetical protein
MATNPFAETKNKNPFADDETPVPVSQNGLKGTVGAAARGLAEAVPFTGEKIAEQAGLPKPKTFPERLTRRAARNLPYALASAPFTGGIPSALGFVGATGLGQLAEEVGVSEEYQPLAEIVGGGVGQGTADVLGRTLGYIQKPLAALTKKAKNLGYEVDYGAKATQGMKYGSGGTPQSAIRNLDKFTEEATARAGKPTTNVNAAWVEQTQAELGNEVGSLFAGKTFTSKPGFQQKIIDVVNEAESIFGQQGNIARTIIEKNIGGQRRGGELLSPQFKAEDLRGAITQVNSALSGAKGPQAKVLHDLKDALEELASKNLTGAEAKQYDAWRKKYNSWSAISDLIQLEGKTGITASGQVNPEKLLDEITRRTGGRAASNPLYKDLGELGDILKSQVIKPTGGLSAALQIATENPLSKGLGTIMQRSVPMRSAGIAGTAQTLAPAQQYLQANTLLPAKRQN